MLAFGDERSVVWFEGNHAEYESDRKRRLGATADQPHRLRAKAAPPELSRRAHRAAHCPRTWALDRDAAVAQDEPGSGHPREERLSYPRSGPDETTVRPAVRIFISYRRGVDPDQSLAQFLYDSLTSRDHAVFKDVEGIPTGGDYADVIANEITRSDFFVVLLTKASAQRGWVVAETEMAKDSADHEGHPKILPVRLAYPQPLPLRLKAAIGHLHHFEWGDPMDNETLVAALVGAIDARPERPMTGSPEPSPAPSRLARGEHFIVTEDLWHADGIRESLAGTTIVPVMSGQETSLSVMRATGPGFFRVRVQAQGALEVAIWSGASYRRVRSQPQKFIALLEGDSHTWCFARYHPHQPVVLKRPGSQPDPIVVTFDSALVRAVWTITHQRGSRQEHFLIAMRHSPTP